jgi:RNA polymerase sigma factor (sigma-70 family)
MSGDVSSTADKGGVAADNVSAEPLAVLFEWMREPESHRANVAWAECYRRYHRQVWHAVLYVVRTIPWLKEPGEVATDVTSEVFARLPQNVSRYREIGKAEGWLMLVAVRTARRHKESLTGSWSQASEKRATVDFEEDQLRDLVTSTEADERDARLDLSRRIEEWSNDPEKREWVEFVNLFLAGFGHDAIAARLGISAPASRTMLWKIRRDLGRSRVNGILK